jgi:hypothetical protein
MSNTAHTVAGMPAPAKSGSPVPTPAGDSHAVTKRLQSELMAMMTSGDAGGPILQALVSVCAPCCTSPLRHVVRDVNTDMCNMRHGCL